MKYVNRESDVVNVFDENGNKLSEIRLPEQIVTIPNKRGGFGESGLYYKGSGCVYRYHTSNIKNPKCRLLGKTGLIYEKYAVSYPELVGQRGIFTFPHQPIFSDFEGGCGPKERRVLENIKNFEMTTIDEIVDVIPTGISNHDIYVYKYKNVSGNILDLQELIEYVLANDYNTAWDKNLISDIEGYKYVRDLADWFVSSRLAHKFGTVFAFLYSLYNFDIYGYVKFINNSLGYYNADRQLIIYHAALLTEKYCPGLFLKEHINIFELTKVEYRKLFVLLFSGVACCHLEKNGKWEGIRQQFCETIDDTVDKGWIKIEMLFLK